MAREIYTHGYAEEHQRLYGRRTADQDAAFFISSLVPGMRLLDCGCGPGSITVGLAKAVHPGEVVAIDIAPVQLDRARRLADEHGASNMTFQRADMYELPFPDNSFDAGFAHNVLEHLRDPVAALREVRRVLHPGGVIGIRDDDWSAYLLEPMTPTRGAAIEVILKVVEHNGGNFRSARFHAKHLREAGFVAVHDFATAAGNGTSEPVNQVAEVIATQLEDPGFTAVATKQAWATGAELAAMAADMRQWGASPDAYVAFFKCAAVGMVPV